LSPIKGKTMKNEKGMVLVLAIFMLALLSMIGLSSMMTSTTDITIAGNDKFSKIVYYQAESGLTVGGELIRLFYFNDPIEPGVIDDNGNIELMKTGFDESNEDPDQDRLWYKNEQCSDCLDCPDCDGVYVDRTPDLQMTGADIDIDRIWNDYAPGGGALFGRGATGGRQYIYAYNVEALATLPANSSIMADHVMGYHIKTLE
jgi:hypothetical protein